MTGLAVASAECGHVAAAPVFTIDVGTPCLHDTCVWAARYLRVNGSAWLIGSFSRGCMANALPHGTRAQAAVGCLTAGRQR